jgi:magnesium transporter
MIQDTLSLLDLVERKDLDGIDAEPGTRIGGLVRAETVSVRVDDDQELAARLMQEADLVALPVLDTEDRLVGVLTVDDAMEIIETEETEDIHRAAGGVEPLPIPYMDAGVLQLARKRAVWLLVLIAAAVMTVNVLLLGLMLGLVALPIVTSFFGWQFAVLIGSTLLAICTWASFSGGLLPLVAKRVGIDPAVVSAPLITTLVDATGLIIYFLLARAVLGL